MMKKLFFKLEVQDDYPPVSEESLWVKALQDNLYQVDNIPFYTKDVSLGDVVSAKIDNEVLYFNKVERNSQNSTLRVVFFSTDDNEQVADITKHLTYLGCELECFTKTFIALSIGDMNQLATVLEYLESKNAQGILDYEMGKLAIN